MLRRRHSGYFVSMPDITTDARLFMSFINAGSTLLNATQPAAAVV